MTTREIRLPEQVRDFIESEVASGGFGDASEYLSSLVHEARVRKARRELEAKRLEGLDSPVEEVTDQFWADMRQEILDKHPELVEEL